MFLFDENGILFLELSKEHVDLNSFGKLSNELDLDEQSLYKDFFNL